MAFVPLCGKDIIFLIFFISLFFVRMNIFTGKSYKSKRSKGIKTRNELLKPNVTPKQW